MAKLGRPRRADETTKLTTLLNKQRKRRLLRLAAAKELSVGKLIEEWIDAAPEPEAAR